MAGPKPSDRYNDNWKKIDQYEKRGLTNSARKEAKISFAGSKRSTTLRTDQGFTVFDEIQHDPGRRPLYLNFQYTDSLARVSPNPVNNILRSIQAEICVTYLNQNRYNLYSRTKLETENEEDIRTWGIDKTYCKIRRTVQSIIRKCYCIAANPVNRLGADAGQR